MCAELKPSADESTRYGKLLFGQDIGDYAKWDAQEGDRDRLNKKLFK